MKMCFYSQLVVSFITPAYKMAYSNERSIVRRGGYKIDSAPDVYCLIAQDEVAKNVRPIVPRGGFPNLGFAHGHRPV